MVLGPGCRYVYTQVLDNTSKFFYLLEVLCVDFSTLQLKIQCTIPLLFKIKNI